MKTPVHGGPRKPTTASISTRLTLAAANAHAVYLAGTFNGWQSDTLPMKKDGQGLWTRVVDLAPGNYEYKFVVDGKWCCDLGCEGEHTGCPKCVPNSLGTMNRLLEVGVIGSGDPRPART